MTKTGDLVKSATHPRRRARRPPLVAAAVLAASLAATAAPAPARAAEAPPCGAAPAFGCRTPVKSDKSSLTLKALPQPRLSWTWAAGDATSAADLGDPTSATGYRLCVYDDVAGAAVLVLDKPIAAGAGWRATASGFRYTGGSAPADGISSVVLRSGLEAKAKITASGKGAALGLPALPLHQSPAVTVQVQSERTCWQARYAAPASTSSAAKLVAKAEAGPRRYGVMASNGLRPSTIDDATAAGAGWVRVNASLSAVGPTYASLLQSFLDAGLNLVVTVVNDDPALIDTTYGDPATYPNAGFPILPGQEAAYRQRVHDIVAPLVAAVDGGRQVVVQAENEIGAASLGAPSQYWRGSVDQYLALLAELGVATKAASPRFAVAVSSFTSDMLDSVLVGGTYATTLIGRLLAEGTYDTTDLHFYGRPEDIAAKVAWVRDRLPAGKRWISTENAGPDLDLCGPSPPSWCTSVAGFRAEQQAQVAQRLEACADGGGSVCLWFSLYDLIGEVARFNRLGLIDPRVSPPARKPAFDAFASFAATHH